MEFCPECGSMLLPTEDNELKCSCGYTKKLSKDKSEYNVNEKIKENDSVIEKGEDVNTLPTTKAVCPECGSKNLTKIDRMNGYLSYSRVKGDTRLNEAKMEEIKDRVSM